MHPMYLCAAVASNPLSRRPMMVHIESSRETIKTLKALYPAADLRLEPSAE